MTMIDEWKRFALVLVVLSLAGGGVSLLPPDDYQPSRPAYAVTLLLAALIAFYFTRRSTPWLHSATQWLSVAFVAFLLMALLM